MGQVSLLKELQEEVRAELREVRSSEEERRREPRANIEPFVPLHPSAFIPSMTPLPTMEACPELVPHSGLLCMMVVHRGTHTSHSLRCWPPPLDGDGESDATGCESEKSGINSFI